KHDQGWSDQRVTDADLADTATDFHLTGYFMGQVRTADTRHKRAVAVSQALVETVDGVIRPGQKAGV
ncbi:MAG TPA: hypothetical protein VGC10_03420, partial [Sphingomonas sp.]